MRVLMDGVPTLSKNMGGIGYYCYYLLQNMVQQAPENTYELLYNTSKHRASNISGFKESWVKYPYTKILRYLGPRLFFQWPLENSVGDFDIWHGTDSNILPTRRAKKIVTIHDLEFIKSPATMSVKDIKKKMAIIPYSIEKADHIIAVSQSTKDHIMEIFDIPNEKITVTHLAAAEYYRPLDIYSEEVQQIRDKYHLPSKYILYVGGVYPRKNLVRILQAFSIVKQRLGCAHKFVIVGGNGDNLPEVQEAIEKFSLIDEVFYPGYVAIEDMPAIYNLAEEFIHVSLFEGFGLPPLEALQCGIPTIVSNLTSLPEVAGDAALFAHAYEVDDIADKIEQFIVDEQLRQRYHEKGILQAAKFSWKNTAKETLHAYDICLSK